MSNNHDKPEQWVDDFLDVWQEQLSHLMKDPKAIMELLQPDITGMPMQWPPDLSAFFNYSEVSGASTQSDSSLSANRDAERSDVASRLSEYEKRIAELEQALKDQGK